ncbi:hypothetical protein Pfo_010669 [Paulownia fortunei]|nr:hypothetical protein Pfo_010669 [Paulownia fortunei]
MKNMKRDSVSFDQSHAVDDEPNAKLRYQSLLKEYLELQKVYVSRKRKLQAEMQKRETILAEVRFLRRRHKYLLKTRASNMGKVPLHLPNSDIKSNAIEGERSQSALEASPENSGRVLVTNSHLEDEGGEGEQLVPEEEVRFAKKPKNYLIHDKGVGTRKIFWPDKVALKYYVNTFLQHCRIPQIIFIVLKYADKLVSETFGMLTMHCDVSQQDPPVGRSVFNPLYLL